MTTSYKGTLALGVFGFTLFLSAALMFALQPMVGKMLLPLVGGTPAGWIVALAFFQIMLLAGYLLAHLFSALTLRKHGMLYLLGLLCGALFLPISLVSGTGVVSSDTWGVFTLLTANVAVPFMVLSTTSSTLQRLFTATSHGGAQDPYFLFAASNLGSFGGLLLYPVLAEPLLTLDQQAGFMRLAYFVLIAVGCLCLFLTEKPAEQKSETTTKEPPPAAATKLQWLLLSLVPSSLLLGVTSYMTTELFSAPMLWILPLGFYLLTFVVAFANRQYLKLQTLENIYPYLACLAVFVISVLPFRGWLSTFTGAGFFLLTFTVICLSCHMRLASLRPANRYLTSFYLLVALGGAMGGALNAFVVPFAFNRLVEFPLMIIVSLLLHAQFRMKTRSGIAAVALLAIAVTLANLPTPLMSADNATYYKIYIFIVLLSLVYLLLAYAKKLVTVQIVALGTVFLFFLAQFGIANVGEVESARSIYSTIAIIDKPVSYGDEKYVLRYMRHGNTNHGLQIKGKEREKTLTSYYTAGGPIDNVFHAYNPKNVLVLGLGAGTLNCFEAPGRKFTFVEIDPEAVRLAQDKFTFLSACAAEDTPKVVIGDGRLELARMKDAKFDMIIADAFTSDSIPTHLLTEEAFALYTTHLTPGGVIAVNLSNRYLDLWDIVATTAGTQGLETRARFGKPEKPLPYATASIWAAVTRKGEMSEALAADTRWKIIPHATDLRAWSDNYTNLFSILMRPSTQMKTKQ